MLQPALFDLPSKYRNVNPKDVVFTPDNVAKTIVDLFNPSGVCLDPCRGEGAFYKYLPVGSLWCEIAEGKDFYSFSQKVDWIVSNPPYSEFDKWLFHSFEIADNIVYLIPVYKVWKNWNVMMSIKKWGGVKAAYYLPASRAGFPFGFPAGAFHFQRGYTGAMEVFYAHDAT